MNSRRRRVLRGLGGFAIALPFLEYFAPKHSALAAPPPKRFALLFAGMSVGAYGGDQFAPGVGPLANNLTRGLANLKTSDWDVTDAVSLVSGLSIPTGSSPPTAGRPIAFHSTSHQVIVSGQRFDTELYGAVPGPSIDWVAAETLAGNTQRPVLVYRAQPVFYRAEDYDGGTDGIISARMNGGELEQIAPTVSPRVAFESLFEGFTPPDPEEAAKAKRLLAMRKSVVDLCADDAEALLPKLGKADRVRLERHFDELRALESRLEQIELPDSPSCGLLDHPGDDPPVGNAIIPPSGASDYNSFYDNDSGYSNEELRTTLLTDYIHMAFACDLSRVASLMITQAQCFMNMNPVLGMPSDLHEISHGSIPDMQGAIADCASWHIKHFARLIDKLRNTEDVDGSSLLDNTALALAFEGGWGYDPEGGLDESPHSTENMVMLVGGKAGGLNANGGEHLVAQGKHPAAVFNSILRAVGSEDSMGEVSDEVPELLG